MTVAAIERGRARSLLWAAMPLMAAVNQYLAMRTAAALQATPFGWVWLTKAATSPWVQAWIGCEILTFAAWMTVLSALAVSAAFPMTALGYVLVTALGWCVFAEPVTYPELIGGALILTGVWLMGQEEAAS